MKLAIYYFLKLLMVVIYTYTIVYLFNYSLIPLFNLYGFWPFLGTIMTMSLIAFFATFAFWVLPKPKKPQAIRHPDLNIDNPKPFAISNKLPTTKEHS
jgi:hypothetical protein